MFMKPDMFDKTTSSDLFVMIPKILCLRWKLDVSCVIFLLNSHLKLFFFLSVPDKTTTYQ